MKKRKLVVFAQPGVGGAERMSVTVTKNLDANTFDVLYYLIGKWQGDNAPLERFIPKRHKVHCTNSNNPFIVVIRFFIVLLIEKPNVVFSSVININNKLLLLRNIFKKIKYVIRCDNYLYTYSKSQQHMIAKLYPKADCIIAQTQEMKDELVIQLGIDERKIVTLHNPIDRQTIDMKVASAGSPYPNNGKKHFVAVGRFNRQKGFDLLIDAFIEVCKTRIDVDLYIVGDNTLGGGTIYHDITQKAKDNGLEDIVHCVGYKDNPYVYLKNADCFVLSSRWEGLPNVLIEALYLGTPVASFKCIPVIERIVDHGVNGFLAEKDDVNSLANAMTEAIKLNRVVSSYHSAPIDDYVELFK